jgi:hypothetical protein
MAKTKTPRTPSTRSKKNGTDITVTPVVTAAADAVAPELRADLATRPEAAPLEVKTPVLAPAIKETRKPLTEVRRSVVPINLEEEIRRRAYQLYEARGCMPGHENDDWLVAEREILTRYSNPRQHSA